MNEAVNDQSSQLSDRQVYDHLVRTVQSLQQRNDQTIQELSLVRRVSDCLGRFKSVDQVCLSILNIVTEEVDIRSCSIMLLDEARKILSIRAVKGSEEEHARFLSPESATTFRLGEGIAGLAAQNGETIRVDDVSQDTRFLHLSSRNAGSMLCLPMFSRDKTIGVFMLNHPVVGYFNKEHERVLRIIANQAGLILDYMQVLEQLRTTEEKLAQHVQNLEYEIKHRAAQLVQTEKLAAIGTFVSGVAHELNNPLSIVVGYADILRRSETISDKDRKKIDSMQTAGIRAGNIVRDLLSFTGSKELRQTNIQFNGLLGRILEERNAQLQELGISIMLETDPHLPDILGDETQLILAFSHVIDNAIDAMAKHPGPRILTIGSRLAGAHVEIAITDTGAGIPENIRNEIFDPFMTTKEPGEGVGLGISLSYWIFRQHGGSVVLDTSYHNGARFVITLPVIPTIAPAARAGVKTIN